MPLLQGFDEGDGCLTVKSFLRMMKELNKHNEYVCFIVLLDAHIFWLLITLLSVTCVV